MSCVTVEPAALDVSGVDGEVTTTPSQLDVVSAEIKVGSKALYDLVPVATDDELRLIDELRAEVLQALGDSSELSNDAQALLAKESLLRFTRARPTIAASTTMLLASLSWRERRCIGTASPKT